MGSMASFVLILAPIIGQITQPALAGIMFTVAYDTVQWGTTFNTFKAVIKNDGPDTTETRLELAALLLTGVICYKVDAALGIVAGVVFEQGLKKVLPPPEPQEVKRRR